MPLITIDGHSLTLEDVGAVASEGAATELLDGHQQGQDDRHGAAADALDVELCSHQAGGLVDP